MEERREDFELRVMLDKCQPGSREIYRRLAEAYPGGIVTGDDTDLQIACRCSINVIRAAIGDLRANGLVKRHFGHPYYMPLVIRVMVANVFRRAS